MDPHPARLGQDPAEAPARLDVFQRAGAARRRPPGRMRPRQGDRRLVLDQRHGVRARQPRRLRPLGATRSARLVLRPVRCPISASWRAGRAAPTPTAAATGRSRPSSAATRIALLGAYIEAGQTAGYGWTEDYNGAQQEGFGRLQMTIRNGRRCSAATGLSAAGAAAGPNLTVETGALADAHRCSRARAPPASNTPGRRRRTAPGPAREVILCGGVINSPQLLMLSGIGDRRTSSSAHGDRRQARRCRASAGTCRTMSRRS